MAIAFYLASAVAVSAAFMAVTRLNAIRALLYFVVSLLAVAVIMLLLGAPFAAALEVIIYAGAIMVLFVFVVMILSMGPRQVSEERQWLGLSVWAGPAVLTSALLAELLCVLGGAGRVAVGAGRVSPGEVGRMLFGPYMLGVELASMLLLFGLVGAFHLAYRLGKGEKMSKAGGRT